MLHSWHSALPFLERRGAGAYRRASGALRTQQATSGRLGTCPGEEWSSRMRCPPAAAIDAAATGRRRRAAKRRPESPPAAAAEDEAEAAMRSSEWRDGRGGITGRRVGFWQPGCSGARAHGPEGADSAEQRRRGLGGLGEEEREGRSGEDRLEGTVEAWKGGLGFWTSAAPRAAFRGFCTVSFGRRVLLSSEGWYIGT